MIKLNEFRFDGSLFKSDDEFTNNILTLIFCFVRMTVYEECMNWFNKFTIQIFWWFKSQEKALEEGFAESFRIEKLGGAFGKFFRKLYGKAPVGSKNFHEKFIQNFQKKFQKSSEKALKMLQKSSEMFGKKLQKVQEKSFRTLRKSFKKLPKKSEKSPKKFKKAPKKLQTKIRKLHQINSQNYQNNFHKNLKSQQKNYHQK